MPHRLERAADVREFDKSVEEIMEFMHNYAKKNSISFFELPYLLESVKTQIINTEALRQGLEMAHAEGQKAVLKHSHQSEGSA